MQENGDVVYFYSGCTVINTSFFSKEVTVDVYSYKDAESLYITKPELQVKYIEFLRTGEIVEGNQFVIEPLSSRTLSIISTGEYGGYGTAQRHPADTLKVTGKFVR